MDIAGFVEPLGPTFVEYFHADSEVAKAGAMGERGEERRDETADLARAVAGGSPASLRRWSRTVSRS